MTAGVKSVQWRILVRLLPLLALIFAGLLFWVGKHLTEVLRSTTLELARRSNVAVVYAVQATMIAEGGHEVWDRIVERIPRHEETKIDIINPRGQTLFSTDPADNKTRRLSDSPCNLCHENDVTPTVEAALLRRPGGEEYQVFAAPLINAEACRGCHDTEEPNLGMVLVQQSLQSVNEQVRTVQITLAAVGGIVLLLTMLMTRLLLGRYLNRPLRRLVAGAKAIGAGDLDSTIELPEHTELAVLADTLNQSTARLSLLQRELLENERLAAMGQTVAGLSHTLKNVLNGLRAGQYVLDRAREKGDDEKLRKGLRVTKNSVRRVERLIFDMLYYAKERVPRREPIEPNDIIREVTDELREMAEARGVELSAEVDEGVGMVGLDRTSIYRALVDLVTNALDACTESESGDSVILRSRATPDGVVFTVEDNGIGMSDEVLSNLYTRFYSTKAAGGTGLGLHVVKKIAEEHGGAVKVDSVPGEGSAFHIHLPRATEA
jgi:signal transduction histidine kinase